MGCPGLNEVWQNFSPKGWLVQNLQKYIFIFDLGSVILSKFVLRLVFWCINKTLWTLHMFYCRYDVVIASDVARTRTNGCIFFKLRDPSVDVLPSHYYSHKFVCVAPYSTDTLLLINIPKTMLEKVIKVGKNLKLGMREITWKHTTSIW